MESLRSPGLSFLFYKMGLPLLLCRAGGKFRTLNLGGSSHKAWPHYILRSVKDADARGIPVGL